LTAVLEVAGDVLARLAGELARVAGQHPGEDLGLAAA
jgi:hypothetical protein